MITLRILRNINKEIEDLLLNDPQNGELITRKISELLKLLSSAEFKICKSSLKWIHHTIIKWEALLQHKYSICVNYDLPKVNSFEIENSSDEGDVKTSRLEELFVDAREALNKISNDTDVIKEEISLHHDKVQKAITNISWLILTPQGDIASCSYKSADDEQGRKGSIVSGKYSLKEM